MAANIHASIMCVCLSVRVTNKRPCRTRETEYWRYRWRVAAVITKE